MTGSTIHKDSEEQPITWLGFLVTLSILIFCGIGISMSEISPKQYQEVHDWSNEYSDKPKVLRAIEESENDHKITHWEYKKIFFQINAKNSLKTH